MTDDTTCKCRLCVVGSANVDLTFRTSRLPLAGETFAGHSFHQRMGGKGANQAVAAARLGARVAFVACVGNDGFGTDAINACRAAGVDTSFINRCDEHPTGSAAILVDDNAENAIVVVAGANGRLAPSDVEGAAAAIQQADVVLCQLETPAETVEATFRIARRGGVLTVLTPAPASQATDDLLALCDVCVPNKSEIAAIVGHEIASLADARIAAKLLRDRGVRQVGLTLGAEGVLIVDDEGATHIPAPSVQAVDTTGAGDAFTAALGVALATGFSLRESAARAVKVAAISVTRSGTQSSFPSLSEVSDWLPFET